MKKKLLVASVLSAFSITCMGAEDPVDLPTISVDSTRLPEPDTVTLEGEDVERGIVSDGGDLLRSVTGVAGGRMGGHGIEPVIRGQSDARLNILLDGAYVQSACPSRMDPPTSYAAIETYDKITVIKGSQTVVYGGGGSGGTVLFERFTPRLSEGENLRAKVGAGYEGNANTQETFADVTAGGTQGFVRGAVHYRDADNYEDGDGNEVRSAYTSKGGNVTLGYTPSDATRLELGVEATRDEDVLFAGSSMDAPESNSDTVRLKFNQQDMPGAFEGLKVELYHSDVDHLMDNYTLRTPPNPRMLMRTPAESLTYGGRFSVDLVNGPETVWTVGLDYQDNNREAIKYNDFTGQITALMWPDANLAQAGLFGEARTALTARTELRAGLRYDHVEASADKADQRTNTTLRSPNDLYRMYYGISAGTPKEDNIGGFARLGYDLETAIPTKVFLGLSRTVRTANATERFIAGDDNSVGNRSVGNPGLDPEKHYQLEAGFAVAQNRFDLKGTVYYDWVDDYILRDRARGQDGILLADGATIYRNVAAELYGAELEITRRFGSHWITGASLAYVHSTNTDDDVPIAQTPPLEGRLTAEYRQARWSLGSRLRLVARQDRVDDDPATGSGLDFGETPGFGVLDLFGSLHVQKRAEVGFGIDNVFDKTYAEHLNKRDIFGDPAQERINEPGRTFWVKASASF